MREGRIAFRNVFLKPIGITELFNHETLEGWSVVDGSQSRIFDQAENRLHSQKALLLLLLGKGEIAG